MIRALLFQPRKATQYAPLTADCFAIACQAMDGFIGHGRAFGLVDVDELTPGMRHAGNLVDVAGAVEVFEPGVTIGVHPALILREMIFGVLPFAIW